MFGDTYISCNTLLIKDSLQQLELSELIRQLRDVAFYDPFPKVQAF